MDSKGAVKRKRIFELYSKNWEFTQEYLPKLNIDDAYKKGLLCPLCFKLFREEGLKQKYSDSLTLEDIPPKKLGGKASILTCKKCNNESGHKLDSKLLRQRHVNSFLKGDQNSNVDVFVAIEGSFRAKGNLTLDSKKNIFRLHFNDDNTKRIVESLRKLPNEGISKELSFRFEEPSRRISQIAELRIAYLIAFSKWGYALIIENTYQPIRDQIIEPEKEILPSFGVMNPEELSHGDGLFIVTEPRELSSILVIFSLKLKHKTEKRAVLLPGLGEDCMKFYETIRNLKGKTNLKYTEITFDIGKSSERTDVLLPILTWEKQKQSVGLH